MQTLAPPALAWMLVALAAGCTAEVSRTEVFPEGRYRVVPQPGTYQVKWRALEGVPEENLSRTIAMLNLPAAHRLVCPAFRDEEQARSYWKWCIEKLGPSISDFRVDFDYRVDESGSVTGTLIIDRFLPYRAHWTKHVQGTEGKPIVVELEEAGHPPVTMEFRVFKTEA